MERSFLETPRASHSAALAWLALVLLVPWPSFGILGEMVFFPGPLGASILAFGKLWLLAFPLAWTALVDREPLRMPGFTTRGFGLALLTGAVGSAVVLAAFELHFQARIDPAEVRAMADQNGFLEPRRFLAVAAFICLVNSLLEEYVWRWFVVRQLRRVVPAGAALVLAAAAFTLHHTIILQAMFGLELAVVGSVAVFAAGLAWSWLYARSGSIWSPWLSHALIDVAVCWAAWQILFN